MIRSISSKNKSSKNPPGCFAIGWCLFSSIFIIAGLGISIHQAKLWTWKKAPCEILEFQIHDHPNKDEPFTPEVRFRFPHQGQEFFGTKIEPSKTEYSKYEVLVEIERKAQEKGICFYDPNHPEDAILKRSTGGVWGGLAFAVFGSFFFLIGVGMFREKKNAPKALSSKSSSGQLKESGFLGFGFFGLFTLVGVGVFLGLVLPTAKKYLAAKTWEPVNATVIWSKVRSHSSDDGTTYSPDVFYRYRFQGEDFRSNNFSLMSGSSSGYDRKKEIVAAHPPGHTFTCYVNPNEPWQAVVQAKLGWWALFGLFPLPFLAVGLGGLWWMLKGSKSNKSPNLPIRSGIKGSSPQLPKKPKSGNRWGKFLGHLFFALFWCGIVSVFLTFAWKDWAKGDPEWFLIIFMIPFVLVGLFLLGTLPHSFLAIFSPRFDLDFRDPELKPGLATKFRWKQSGGSGQLTEMTITLEGREEATYQRGTDRATATSLFYQKEIFKSSHLPEMIANECDLIFPADTLPSFEGEHNKICWCLRMNAAVKARPDVREEIEITLQPLTENDFR
ncbi:MAG: DUF3592 domain-containing protein [Roseibacillus sp.]